MVDISLEKENLERSIDTLIVDFIGRTGFGIVSVDICGKHRNFDDGEQCQVEVKLYPDQNLKFVEHHVKSVSGITLHDGRVSFVRRGSN